MIMKQFQLIMQCTTISLIAYVIRCKPNIHTNKQKKRIMTIRMTDGIATFLHRHNFMTSTQLKLHSKDKHYRGQITLPF